MQFFLVCRGDLFDYLRYSPQSRLSIFLDFLTNQSIVLFHRTEIAVLGTRSRARHTSLLKERARLIFFFGVVARVADSWVELVLPLGDWWISRHWLTSIADLLIFLDFASKLVLQANEFVYELILLYLEKVISPVDFVQKWVDPLHCQLFCLQVSLIFFGGWLHVFQVFFAQLSWPKTQFIIAAYLAR